MYRIIAQNETKFTIELNADHEIFAGHFPDAPILPGVCLLEITEKLLSTYLQKKVKLTLLKSIKIVHIIHPITNSMLDFNFNISSIEADKTTLNTLVSFDGIVFAKINSTYSI